MGATCQQQGDERADRRTKPRNQAHRTPPLMARGPQLCGTAFHEGPSLDAQATRAYGVVWGTPVRPIKRDFLLQHSPYGDMALHGLVKNGAMLPGVRIHG